MPTSATDPSLLRINGAPIPPYAARGINQTLTPIQQNAVLRRTINGAIIDLGLPQFQLYASTLSCDDMDSPHFDGWWRGQILTIQCIVELSYATGGSPQRQVVSGSSRSANGFTFYRPELVMVVTDFNLQEDEFGRSLAWQLSLEELGNMVGSI
jgi:hypothetical protein